MKIWTKRAVGVGAIIGGLLVAGSVAANAADLPLVSSLPLVGNGQQQAAAVPAVPAHMAVPQMGSSKASPKHEANRQKAVVSRGTRPGYGSDKHGDSHDPSVVVGNASGNKTIVGTGNTSVNAPVNVCGNPESNGGLLTGSQCRNRQNHVAVGHAG